MTLQQFARIVEIRTKIISVSTFALATLYSVFTSGGFRPILFFLMLVAVLCVDMGTTAFNSFYDFVRGVDNRKFNVESDKVLLHEGLPARTALRVSLALFAAAVALGLVISYLTTWEVAVAGAISMLVGYLYNGSRHPISRTPFGELAAGGFLGSVLFLITVYVLTGLLTVWAVLASIPSTLLIGSVLTVNNTCDVEGDTAAGRRTLSILLGRSRGELLVYVLGSIAYTAVALLSLLRIFPLLTVVPVLIAAGFSVQEYRRMHGRGYSHRTKGPSMGAISRVVIQYTFAVCAGLLIGVVGRYWLPGLLV
ncbi:MAG TPA: prenyltransferase [Spirochaetia bacterium]|nr:prenyltransferase [Spirochaetia bacterium]